MLRKIPIEVWVTRLPSLKMGQFWYISTNEVPRCLAAAVSIWARCVRSESMARATKEHPAPRATARSVRGHGGVHIARYSCSTGSRSAWNALDPRGWGLSGSTQGCMGITKGYTV